ncbi:DUF4169 family protein [Methylocapsa acidiphila]|uniref:DUF4169 family protein n=1 Tax=Methylocapsa acidiphila TaxID=133552 RepID=UPI0004798D36|nr:DUF4169 family protein [Methylocapsa acidiphila]
MGEIVNLRRVRKTKARAAEAADAAANRVKFGQSRAERAGVEAQLAADARRLDAHRRESLKSPEAPFFGDDGA